MFEINNKFLARLIESSFADTDTHEEIVHKRLLFTISLIVTSAGFIWGVIYTLFGYYLAAFFPFLYAFLSVLGLIHLTKTQKLYLFQSLQLYSILIIPFFLMWSLGGFYHGSFAMLWAFYAPTATILYSNQHSQKRWFSAFAILTIISLIIDDSLINYVDIPEPYLIKIFFALNIIASLGGIQLLINHFANLVSERNKNELEYKSTHDSLTTLPNRKYLIQHLEKTFEKYENVALFVVALDHFKEINDSLGHQYGNKVLINASKKLQQLTTRHANVVARLNGDEYAISYVYQDLIELEVFAERILKTIQVPLEIDNHTVHLTASIGVAHETSKITPVDTLFENAHTAMNSAKHSGKNNCQFYTQEMTRNAYERNTLLSAMRTAIDKKEFIVYYQPQFDASKNRLTGMEALIRWNHPQRGLISPNDFIPLAEESGLIVAIDRLMMMQAIETFRLWYKKGYTPGVIALNLSMKQLEEDDFIFFLQNILSDCDANKPFFALEITESQIMQNPEKAITLLNKIHDLGINLAIDDFGTGHSSLSYLKKLPVQKLKIDQSFVRGLPKDDNDVAIVKSVISLAKNLHMSVIAEGVETEGQRDFLLHNGCQNIQGYYYARPMPEEDIEALLEAKVPAKVKEPRYSI